MLFNALSSTCICIKTIIRAHGSFIQNDLTNSTPTLPHVYRSTASSEHLGSFFRLLKESLAVVDVVVGYTYMFLEKVMILVCNRIEYLVQGE